MPAVLLFSAALPARAGEMDLLLDRLVEKSVITSGEARRIAAGAGKGEDGKPPLKLGGDLRLRYQYNDNRNKDLAQHRGRFRLRVFADVPVNDRVRAGFGLASGYNADPRSANQTLGDNNAKKGLWIDHAFAEYNAGDSLAFTAGRTKNPLWLTSDMLWDTDINMEGLSARLTLPVNSNWQVFGSAGFMVLAEASSDPKDPYMMFVQPGLAWRGDGGVWDLKAGAAVYTFSDLAGSSELAYRPSAADGYQRANTLVRGEYKYNYDALSPELELNANMPAPVKLPLLTSLLGCDLTYAGLFGSYIKSLDHGRKSEGWIAGFRLGQRKVSGAGQWQLRYSLRRLEGDAWLDSYPDSDFYGGSTGVKGHEAMLTLGLLRDFTADLDYYQASPVGGGLKGEKLFQADVNLRF